MPSIIKTLKVVADPNRLRILLLLKDEELSVAEFCALARAVPVTQGSG